MVGAVASMLLLVAVVWLWVRNLDRVDYVEYGGNGKWLMKVISGHGTLDFLVSPRWPQDEEFRIGQYDNHVYYGTRYSKRVLGFGTDAQWPEYGGRYVNIPHWFVTSTTGLLAFLFGWRWWVGRKRATKGCCVKCGYDLRASPERCPECGWAIQQAAV